MRMRRAQDGGEQRAAGHRHVIAKPGQAGQERSVFGALDRLADVALLRDRLVNGNVHEKSFLCLL